MTGLAKPAYAMDWADLDGDGDLDAATASYDIGLTTELGTEYLLNEEGGVYIHWNEEGVFRAQRLSTEAQALAIAIWDENGDGRPDLLVGNDFALPDEFWRNEPDGWSLATIFPETTHSTMSFDLADVDNSGKTALFASDMKPPDMSEETVQAWAPLMEKEHPPLPAGDPQRMENMLLVADRAGDYQSLGRERQLDATGWSWSGLFGDLDRDGLLDLYIVNGFAEEITFAHLDGHELVERNQVLRNTGGGFARMPAWDLGSERGGRGAAQGDLDGDGDLDIVVNNLRGNAQLFENRLCGGASLQVELRQLGSANTAAIGATALLGDIRWPAAPRRARHPRLPLKRSGSAALRLSRRYGTELAADPLAGRTLVDGGSAGRGTALDRYQNGHRIVIDGGRARPRVLDGASRRTKK